MKKALPEKSTDLYLSLIFAAFACIGAIFLHPAALLALTAPFVISMVHRGQFSKDLLLYFGFGAVMCMTALWIFQNTGWFALFFLIWFCTLAILARIRGDAVLAMIAGMAVVLSLADHPAIQNAAFVIGLCLCAATLYLLVHYARMDLTAQLDLKNGLSRRTQRIRYLLRERDEVTALTVHDLQSPIQAIAGMQKTVLHMLDQKKPDIGNIRSALTAAIETNNELSDRIGSLLSHHRDHLGGAADTIGIDAILRGMLAVHEMDLKTKQIAVTCHSCPDIHLRNEEDIKDILDVVLDNAIRHANDVGTIEIRVAKNDQNRVSVEIHDNGSGVPKSLCDTLFSQPGNAQSATTRQGIGLFLARRRIERLGGSLIYKRSDLGGACFQATFPSAQ